MLCDFDLYFKLTFDVDYVNFCASWEIFEHDNFCVNNKM